jgi:uncharacterized protein
MNRRLVRCALRLCVFLLLALIVAVHLPDARVSAQPVVPQRTGDVVDLAGIINGAQEQALSGEIATFKRDTGAEMAIVTLPSLRGYPIEAWGRAIGNGWNLGGATGRGVLLVVAPNERELRIEVGAALENTLTDATGARIIRDVIVPRFKAGDMNSGLSAAVSTIADVVAGREVEATGKLGIRSATEFVERYQSWIPWIIVGIFLLVVLVRWFRNARLEPSDDYSRTYESDQSYYNQSHYHDRRRDPVRPPRDRHRDRESQDSGWTISWGSGGFGSGSSSSRSSSGGGGFRGGGASGKW